MQWSGIFARTTAVIMPLRASPNFVSSSTCVTGRNHEIQVALSPIFSRGEPRKHERSVPKCCRNCHTRKGMASSPVDAGWWPLQRERQHGRLLLQSTCMQIMLKNCVVSHISPKFSYLVNPGVCVEHLEWCEHMTVRNTKSCVGGVGTRPRRLRNSGTVTIL